MKNLLLSLILLTGCVVASAQVNFHEGIVITLQGDTLHGMIDYRTDRINSEQCVFMANGASATTTYLPGQIEGYRFLDNGRFYVSRNAPTPVGSNQVMFLEYVLRGQLNLYYLRCDGNDFFYLEDGTGTLAMFKDIPEAISRSERRKNLASAIAILYPSKTAQELLWEKGTTLANVIHVVRTYNDEVCPNGTCELFQFKAARKPQADRIKWHPIIQAGYGFLHLPDKERWTAGDEKLYVHTSYTFRYAYHIALGTEFYYPRISPQMLVQFQLAYLRASMCKHTKITKTYYEPFAIVRKSSYTEKKSNVNIFVLKAGTAYEWHRWQKVRPRVGVGLEITNEYPFGEYACAGISFPMHKGAIYLNAEFNSNFLSRIGFDPLYQGAMSLGYQF